MVTPTIGEIRMFAGIRVPENWAMCDGQLLSTQSHKDLFNLIGTNYGGNGVTTFGLPDLRGRVPIHWGQGRGLTERPIGSKGGGETASVTENEIPSHDHSLVGQTAPATTAKPVGNMLSDGTLNAYHVTLPTTPRSTMSPQAIAYAGNGEAHDNMMPFQVIHYAIALVGKQPSIN